MDYRNLGKCGVKVSPVCLGTMMFGGQTSESDSIRIVHEALGRGVNFVDTADMYNAGESEVVTGKAIADRRDQVVLATKGRNKMGEGPNDVGGSRFHMMRAVEDSLRRLGTDRIDVYYYHAPDESTPLEETLRALEDMVQAGKVLYVALSNFRAWRISEALWMQDALGMHPLTCIQPLYNIFNRDVEVEILPMCQHHGLGVVTYSPLARGLLTGKYRPGEAFPEGSRASRQDARMLQAELRDASIELSQQIRQYAEEKKGCSSTQFSIAWCLANPILSAVILGPRTMEQFDDNWKALELEITPEDEAFVDSLVPVGEHSGKGFQDSAYPITGRGR